MYDYIKGEVTALRKDSITLENGGIGYRIYCSAHTLQELVMHQRYQIYISHVIREDSQTLYGFLQEEELAFFELLTSVSTIGPRTGIGILSHLKAWEIRTAIDQNDVATLTTCPGIGKKTAGRIILELKDKLDGLLLPAEQESPLVLDDEIVEALAAFGYPRCVIIDTLRNLDIRGQSVETIVKMCIRAMAREERHAR